MDNNNTLVCSNTREEFIENIKKWVVADSQLKIVNEKTKKLREYKNNLTDSITKYIEDKNIKTTKIQISDGELRFYNKKEYSPLTFTYIEKCLAEIIPEQSHVEYIIEYLKENRETTNEMDIRRVYNK
jgi:hypothetical protein